MSETMVYLRQDVVVEPLINQWHAWPLLFSPVTAPLYINHQLKLMQSFVDAPQLHISALKNPAMRGGPFVELSVDDVPNVRALLEKTRERQAHMLAFAEALKGLESLLAAQTGFSLEGLYAAVPEPLRGFVELVYDMGHHASARFIEPLLYRSQYANIEAQSIVLWRPDDAVPRPFVFSTPHMLRPEELHVAIPFASAKLDVLYRARRVATPVAELADVLGVANMDALAPFITKEPPRKSEPYTGSAPRVRYLGHACILIETADVSILIDPIVSYDTPAAPERFSYGDLPEHIDYVLITHNHQDHVVFETLLELRHRVGTVVVPRSGGGTLCDTSLARIIKHLGYSSVIELDELDEMPVPGGRVLALPFLGEHADLDVRSKTGFAITLAGRTVLAVADSNNLEPKLYEHVRKLVGEVDALFIGMECEGAPMSWLYGPLFSQPVQRKMDQSRRYDGSNFLKASDIVERFDPKHVFVYAMGHEPWLGRLMSIQYTPTSLPIVESDKLIAHCRERGKTADRPYCRMELLVE